MKLVSTKLSQLKKVHTHWWPPTTVKGLDDNHSIIVEVWLGEKKNPGAVRQTSAQLTRAQAKCF